MSLPLLEVITVSRLRRGNTGVALAEVGRGPWSSGYDISSSSLGIGGTGHVIHSGTWTASQPHVAAAVKLEPLRRN